MYACARVITVRMMVGQQLGPGLGTVRVNLLPQYFGLRNDWRRGAVSQWWWIVFVQITVLFGTLMCIDVKVRGL